MNGQLQDIHGLDTIPWWPPAAGWWIGAVLLALLILLLVLLVRYLTRYPPGSWKQEARHALRQLQRQRNTLTPKESASRLSELLRRIAIARFGRQRSARLSGTAWLEWLAQQDPEGFDWPQHGRILLQLPYAPDDWTPDEQALDPLIDAALRMVSASHEDYQRRHGWRWGRRHA